MEETTLNFGPGPAQLPKTVMEQIHHNMLDWHQTGLSILELGHRSREFQDLVDKMVDSVRKILDVPENFAILFLPAGAQNQFSMTCMNLLGQHHSVNYLDTGHWSQKAISEARKYAEVNVVASSGDDHYHTIPDRDKWTVDPMGAYLHFTDNETIGGLEFPHTPQVDNLFLVSDMSSNIFSRPIDFKAYGCIYACAQKNMGIAGMSIVIVRKDLLDRAHQHTPAVFHYASQYKNNSLLATPPTFAFYVASLIFDWIDKQGGVAQLNQTNQKKSQLLYDYIDASNLYHNPIDKRFRSRMNVPFTFTQPELESKFFKGAKEEGLINLEGHRSVGGARASIYNAMQIEEVQTLINFMRTFEKNHG